MSNSTDPSPAAAPDVASEEENAPPLDPSQHASGDSTIVNLRAATFMLSRRLRYQHVDGEIISPTEAAVLGRLQHGPQTPGQLAKAEHVRPPSMTQTIARLEARGFVQRDPHPEDGRQTLVSRTSHGNKFVDQSRAMRTAWLTAQFEKLNEADRRAIEQAAGALRRLAEQP